MSTSLDQLKRRLASGQFFDRQARKWLTHTIIPSFEKRIFALTKKACEGTPHKTRRGLATILDAGAGKIVSVARVIADGRYEGMDPCNLVSRVQLEALAQVINLHKPLEGFGRVSLRRKEDGAYRYLINFSGNVRAAQYLLGDVLTALGVQSSVDYAIAGRGRPALAQKVMGLVEEGYHHWLIFDVAKCYPSIRREHLDWLPLPGWVKHSGAFPNQYLSLKGYGNDPEMEGAVQRGLPTGARLSSQIAGALIERMLPGFTPGESGAVSYVDDVGVYARTQGELANVADAIRARFKNHPAGPLNFKIFNLREASLGFDFVKFWFQLNSNGKCKLSLSHVARDQLPKCVWRRLDADGSPITNQDKERVARDALGAFIAGHAPWQPSLPIYEELHAIAVVAAFDHGTSAMQKYIPILESLNHAPDTPPWL